MFLLNYQLWKYQVDNIPNNYLRSLQRAQRKKTFDINCVDSLGRGALTIAIDQENLELVELLVIMGVQTKDALLYAISVEFVEAVELLLEHEELIHKEGEPYVSIDDNISYFMLTLSKMVVKFFSEVITFKQLFCYHENEMGNIFCRTHYI